MRRWREDRGQATGEYVSLILLVAVTLVLGAGLTSGGLGARVLAGLQRGLCAVVGRDCAPPTLVRTDVVPCPLARTRRDERLNATVDVVRLGTSGTLGAVRTSDGHVTVTLADGGDAGGQVGVGLRLAFGTHSVGSLASASVATTWTSGRSWTLPNAAQAGAFIARYGAKATIGGKLVDRLRSSCSLLCDAIGWHPHAQLPEPDEVFTEAGVLAELSSSLGLASARGSAAAVLGVRHARDGTSTWYVRLDGAASAGLGLPSGGLDVGASGRAIVSYALDAQRRPISLGVQLAGRIGANASAGAARDDMHATAGAGRATAVELDATLDLHDPANRAAATALLGALIDPRTDGGPIARAAALGRRIVANGEVDRLRYALRRSTLQLGVEDMLGSEIAGGFASTTETLHLLGAETRLPGLPFLPRDDCRGA